MCLSEKLRSEARNASPYIVRPSASGKPGHITVWKNDRDLVYQGHRDLIRNEYRFAHDPFGLLARPASD